MTELLYCNHHDPRPNGGDARYAFKQSAGETVAEAAVRAAQIVIATGVNRVAHYTGTNHVMAKNAAFAFSAELLQVLKGDDDSDEGVVVSVELLEEFQKRVVEQSLAADFDKVAEMRQANGKVYSFAHVKKVANDMRASADARLANIQRIAQFVPKR